MNHHDEYDLAQLPDYARDPDYLYDIRDPLRAAKGILTMTVIAVVFWSSLCGIVWMANHYIGGG